jgi:hypothetical protein
VNHYRMDVVGRPLTPEDLANLQFFAGFAFAF